MIHYDLRCGQDHRFDGWFKDSAAFDAQSARGLLECPSCGSAEVTRALMSPALRRKATSRAMAIAAAPPTVAGTADAAPAVAEPVSASAPNAVAGADVPAQLRALLQKVRAEVERRCDYVGGGFADEARRMHRGEIEGRGIYGETTPEQAEELRDEGIEIASIPWVSRADG